MKVCSDCGHSNVDDAKVCEQCGRNLILAETGATKKPHHVLADLFLLLVCGTLIYGLANYQNLADRLALATYKPSAEISGFVGRTTMTERAKAMFYRNNPRIDDKTTFNTDCDVQGQVLEIGCFTGRRIYILNITNPELTSNMDVTAAHELLHAAYARLSASEKTQINQQLETAFVALNNKDLNDLIAKYDQSEPGQRDNELHSLLGTQYANLSPELEAHYRQYFSNRSAIVAAYNRSQSAFASREADLNARLVKINIDKASLSALNTQMDTLLRAGRVSDYNALVPRQNALVQSLKSEINAYNELVDEYNKLGQSLNSQQISPDDIQAR